MSIARWLGRLECYNALYSMNAERKVAYRVGLNALLLYSGHGGSYRRAGIDSYIRGLLPHLPAADTRLNYTAFVGSVRDDLLNGMAAVRVPPHISMQPAARVLWEQLFLPRMCVNERVRLLHSMAFVSPVLSPVPTVVTVYDLSFLRLPGSFRVANRIYLSLLTRLSCQRARRVIAISEHTRTDVVELLGVSRERVDVVYPGLSSGFRRASAQAVNAFRERRGLPEHFIFYLGTIEPRKNLSVLINAYNKLRPEGVKLILAGDKGWLFEDVFKTVDELHLSRDVLFPGFLPVDELPLWYSACSAFVYPSDYEGFGLPVLEAMACGAPTITTNAASLPEVAGCAAQLLPPGDVDALADCIDILLGTPSLQKELAASGPVQARRFSWETAGRLTARTYASAMGLPASRQEASKR